MIFMTEKNFFSYIHILNILYIILYISKIFFLYIYVGQKFIYV